MIEIVLPQVTQAVTDVLPEVTPGLGELLPSMVAEPVDYTALLEAVEKLNQSVNQLFGPLDFITVLLFMLGGICLGCAIGIILAVVLK